MNVKGRLRATNSGYRVRSDTWKMRDVKTYEILLGKLARMMDVRRDECTDLLWHVIRQAVIDVAIENSPEEFIDGDFAYNVPEAAEFLTGPRGAIYFSALGMDAEMARSLIVQMLPVELDRAGKWTAFARPEDKVLAALREGDVLSVETLSGIAGLAKVSTHQLLAGLLSEGRVQRMLIPKANKGGKKFGYYMEAA